MYTILLASVNFCTSKGNQYDNVFPSGIIIDTIGNTLIRGGVLLYLAISMAMCFHSVSLFIPYCFTITQKRTPEYEEAYFFIYTILLYYHTKTRRSGTFSTVLSRRTL